MTCTTDWCTAWRSVGNSAAVLLSGSSRPAPRPHAPLPPWDASDAGGIVHTTPPPELVIPSGPDPLFLRADFNGVTLDRQRWGGDPPYLVGANTTPRTMLMTPMAICYPRFWQDAILTEHAERGYTHFVIAPDGWNLSANGYDGSLSTLVSWAAYVKSWGFYVVLWRSAPIVDDPILFGLVAAGCCDWYVAGEEVDRKCTAEQYDAVLASVARAGVPVGAHFTSNYPSGFPRDTFLTDWSPYNGRVHLMWQANQNDSAGTQGARLYYARQRVNLGLVGDGNYSNPAPDSRVYAFETMATAQLYGQCTEQVGCLRSLELLYTTRANDAIPAVNGFGNGCRNKDGSVI